MGRDSNLPSLPPPRGLVVGNYCHDVLHENGTIVAESVGGAVSFISTVLNGLSIPFDSVSKVGPDFKYSAEHHSSIIAHDSKTTLFHAYFESCEATANQDRVLKRVSACNPIDAEDLPKRTGYDFGMAVGVAGEILPQTLEKMIEICGVLFVDIQALIRVFDPEDGTVTLVRLEKSGFYHLLPKIDFLKASAEEALFMDVEEVRRWCCVVVTNGKNGCTVYWKNEELQIAPFVANQIDPTGAGDSFLGGLVCGLVRGLSIPDSALLGNFFGSLNVEQAGLPKFDIRLLQGVTDEVDSRRRRCSGFTREGDGEETKLMKPAGHEQFYSALAAAAAGKQHGHSRSWVLPIPEKCDQTPSNANGVATTIVD